MKNIPLALLAVLLFIDLAYSQNGNRRERPPAVSEATLDLYEPGEFKGVKYRLMKPIDFDPEKTYPLVLSLHGAGGRGDQNVKNLRDWNEMMAEEGLRRKYPAFVLAPQSRASWSDPTSPLATMPEISDELIASLPDGMKAWMERRRSRRPSEPVGNLHIVFEFIDSVLMSEYKIDADRVYCLGHSMGGAGTFTAIYQRPDRFAAAIPTAGVFPPWQEVERIKDIPIWTFHGDDDPTVPYIFTKHVFDRLDAIDGNTKFTTLKGVKHGAQAPAFAYKGDDPTRGFTTVHASERTDKSGDIWDWLFSKARK